MKILMYAPIFPPQIGGPATQSHNLCRALVLRGHTPVVVTPAARFSLRNEDGFRVYRYRWNYTHTRFDTVIRWLIFTPYFFILLLKERPAVLHAHSVSASSFIAGFLARSLKIPRIIKFAGDWVWETLSTYTLRAKDFDHIYESSRFARVMKWVERRGLLLFDVIWCPSEFRKENVRAVLGNTDRVRIIPNSLLLPPGGFHQEQKTDPFVVISANRFIPHKRVSTIVQAFKHAGIKNGELVLIGSGSDVEVEKVRRAISSSGLKEQVRLTGVLSSSEVYELFTKASVYVSASLEEGFPNVFIEAMHFGLPIISTDVGGCREMVVNGVNGFLVSAEHDQEIADRLQALERDRTLRNALAQYSYERSTQYDLSVVVDRFIALYQELIAHA